MSLIILITNKMKIITQLSLINRLFIHQPRHSFSNFIKDTPLSFDDLVINHSKKANEVVSSSSFNSLKTKKVIKEAINADNNQVKIDEMISLIDKSFSQAIIQTQNNECYFQKDIALETQIENAMEFMKYLDHTMQKTVALEIINMVEKYCSEKDYIERENSTLIKAFTKNNNIQMITKTSEAKLFQKIKNHLIHNLNYYSQNIQVNNPLIQSLLEILAKSDPSKITSQFFQRESFCLDEEERLEKSTGKQFYLENNNKFSLHAQNQDNEAVPYQKTEENKYKLALQQAFQLKDSTKFSKLRLRKHIVESEQTQKSQLEKVKVASDNIIFRKMNAEKSIENSKAREEDLKSVYVYELPYNITEAEAEDFIQYLQKSKSIKIQSYVLFPYKNFLQQNHYDVIFKIPQNYQDKNIHIERTLKNISIDDLTRVGSSKDKKRMVRKTKKEQFNDMPLQNKTSGRKVVTDALLLKIKKENYSKFNKSSMIIKFSTKENKQVILTKQSRLYGICYKNLRNIKFQQGYSKQTITLSGIPWGCSSKDFQKFLNKILQADNLSVRIQEDCILTKNMVSIQFDHLSQALNAIKKLNNITFQNKKIRAHLKYGSCKLFNNKYNLSLEEQYEKLKKKIDLLGIYYQKKYDQEPQCSQQ